MAKSPILLGPILYLGKCDEVTWRIRLGVLVRETTPGVCSVSFASSPEVKVVSSTRVEDLTPIDKTLGVFWSFLLEIPRAVTAKSLSYELKDAQGQQLVMVKDLVIPAQGQLPNLAFFSCNGFSSASMAKKALDIRSAEEAYENWQGLLNRHQTQSFHVLVGGGDQIYADQLLVERSFWDFGTDERLKDNAKLESKVGPYMKLYVDRWGKNPQFLTALSRIPLVATWDDHDIFDGWGSWAVEYQECKLFKALFFGAARAFDLFQSGGPEARADHQFGSPVHRLKYVSLPAKANSSIDLLLLDARTQRTRKDILGEQQWTDIKAHFAARSPPTETGKRHLFVVASVPVVYLEFHIADLISAPLGMEDDLRDHWQQEDHRGERAKLIMNLLDLGKRTNTCVSLLSGDVHVAAHGVIKSTRADHIPAHQKATGMAVIRQFTASGIVHPSPSGMEWSVISALTTEPSEEIEPGVTTALSKIGNSVIMRERNWLAIDHASKPEDFGTYICTWMTVKGAVGQSVFLKT